MNSTRHHVRRAAALLLVAGLIATACGDDDGDEAAATTAQTAATSVLAEPTETTEDVDATEDSTETTDDTVAETIVDPTTTESVAAPSGDPWTFALIAPLSGPNASLGQSALTGVEFWIEQRNDAGGIGGRPVELITCDDEGSPEGGSQCGRDLTGEADVFMATGVTGAVRAIHAQLPGELVLNISPNILPEAETTFFQVGASISETVDALFEFAAQNGMDKVGILAATDASGEATIEPAEATAAETGIEVVITRIEPADIEASGQLTRLDSEDIDLLYVSYSGAGAATVVQAYRTLGLQIPIVLNSASVSGAFLDIIASYRPDRVYHLAPVGAIVPETLDEAFRPKAEEFLAKFQEFSGEEADGVMVQVQYAADAAAAALIAAGDDVEAAKAFLQSTPIDSLTQIRFDPSTGNNVAIGTYPSVIESTVDGAWTTASVG